jgi:hypothetical protein
VGVGVDDPPSGIVSDTISPSPSYRLAIGLGVPSSLAELLAARVPRSPWPRDETEGEGGGEGGGAEGSEA